MKVTMTQDQFESMLEVIIPTGFGIKSLKNINDPNSIYSQIINNAKNHGYVKTKQF